jgi:DNA-binding NarL/FixJ family response regulator
MLSSVVVRVFTVSLVELEPSLSFRLFGVSQLTCQPGVQKEAQQGSQEPIRVLVGLDTPLDCQLLKTAVQTAAKRPRQRLDVVACAVSRPAILDGFSRGNVDVALISVGLEDGHLAGLEVLPQLCTAYHKTPVVMLFDAWQDDLIVHAFRVGAKGVFCRLEKDLEQLWKCITAVHEGQVWANSGQLQLLLNALKSEAVTPAVSSPGLRSLAAREMQVANLVAEGLANRDVAAKLGLSEHTVSNYLFRIYNKLGISCRVELALYVMKDRERPLALATSGPNYSHLGGGIRFWKAPKS